MPALPLERRIAEKLRAYTRIYEGDRPSSRTKDLVDIVLIAELAALDATTLWTAIETTFTTRGTNPVPATVPPPERDGTTPFSALATAVGICTDLAAAHAVAADLFDPVLDGTIREGAWDLERRRWTSR